MNKRLLSAFVAAVVMSIFLAPSLAGALHTGPRTYHVRAGWDYTTGFGALVAQAFMPSLLFIRAGDTVVWTNEHSVGEPHTASFNFGNVPHPGFEIPFAVSGEIIQLLPPELGEPLVVDSLPTGEPILIGFNARAFFPVDEWGTWVNSGLLLAEDHVEEFPGSASSWSYTFTEPGTYNYHCVLHHWMTGTIVVLG
ncbi:MAG: hypothetical protein ACE5KH_05235 [Candidatus Geothermarchaeales archaeon]